MKQEEFNYRFSGLKMFADHAKHFPRAKEEVKKQTEILENFISLFPSFETSFQPVKVKKDAPKIVLEMSKASSNFNIGPLSAVAGAIAQVSAQEIKKSGSKLALVENGGDIFIASLAKKITVGIFAKNKAFSDLAFEVHPEEAPIAICSSSGKMGRSTSLGRADLACIVSRSAFVADAGATYLGNLIKEEKNIQGALDKVIAKKDVLGALAIKNNKIGMAGKLPKIVR